MHFRHEILFNEKQTKKAIFHFSSSFVDWKEKCRLSRVKMNVKHKKRRRIFNLIERILRWACQLFCWRKILNSNKYSRTSPSVHSNKSELDGFALQVRWTLYDQVQFFSIGRIQMKFYLIFTFSSDHDKHYRLSVSSKHFISDISLNHLHQQTIYKKMTASLHTLPIDLIYRILDDLSTNEIVLSTWNVCTRMNRVINSYTRFKVKSHFCLWIFFIMSHQSISFSFDSIVSIVHQHRQ